AITVSINENGESQDLFSVTSRFRVQWNRSSIRERNWCGPVKSRRKDNDPLLRAIARHIGILLYPDFQLLDAAAPIASFSIAGAWRATPIHLSASVTRGAGETTDVPA
ncbi:hypothetical protein NKW55_13915, partial [Gluconobacter kondonii]|nr:hypothetical protein [Gluconobacter kondonii]